MKRLAACVAAIMFMAWLLGGCAHVDRDQDDQAGKRRPQVTLVLCLFASCHHIAHPEGGPSDYPEVE